ncbi:MAG: hypothetical protein PUD90_03600 [Clostridia bacterium]|nr:hypothetical protein [Clostridia bacterium]
MGFCTKCGKPLKDGEICSCQQQTPQMTAPQAPAGAAPQMTAPQAPTGAAPQMTAPQAPTGAAPQMSAPQASTGAAPSAASLAQMDAVKQAGANAAANYFSIFKGLISSPVDTINSYMANANIVLVAFLIGAQAVVNMIVRLFQMLISNSGSKYGRLYSTGAIFKNMFLEILLIAVAAAIFALILKALVKAFDKVDITFTQGLAAYGILTIFGIPAKALNWLVGLTSIGFLDHLASCISLFASVTGYVFLFMAIRSLCKNEKNIPLVMGASYVVVSFVTWIVRLMF